MLKRVLLYLAILVLLGAVAWFVFLKADNSVTPSSEKQNTNIIKTDKNDLVIGSDSAPVTIIEYADYKCPTCNSFFREIEPKIRQEYIDKNLVKIIIRQFPHIGLDAKPAAIGAYCANNQNKFKEYHDNAMNFIYDNLFSKGSSLSDDVFTKANLISIANQSNIETTKFKKCLSSKQAEEIVNRDLRLTENEQVTGTPTFIIGDQQIVGAQPFEIFRTLIENKLGEN